MGIETIKTTSRIATASIICIVVTIASGLLFCCATLIGVHEAAGFFVAGSFLFSAIAFVLGIIAVVVITIRRRLLKGYVYAILAILLSSPFILAIYAGHSVTVRRKELEKANTGNYNLRLLGKALTQYAKHHDGCLPAAGRWCDLLMEHNSNLTEGHFRHPRGDELGLGICNFAFNNNLSGLRVADIPDDVVLIFEADGGWNLAGGAELLKKRRTTIRDEYYVSVLFVDQTMRSFWFDRQTVQKFDSRGMSYEPLRWEP